MNFSDIFLHIDWREASSAFIVLFAIIDMLGSVPIVLSLKMQNRQVNPWKATVLSALLLVIFFFAGDALLHFFSVDIQSFAIAGAMIIFIMALEMILDVEIFKNTGPIKDATLIPMVFPLIAGPGAFTTLLSLAAEYHPVNIMIGLFGNMLWVFFVLAQIDFVDRHIKRSFVYVLRKFFGVILLAISVKLFIGNLLVIFGLK